MIKVAGIDQSKNGFGWAIGSDEPDAKPSWGVDHLNSPGSKLDEGLMYHIAAKRMRQIIDAGVQKVFFEQPVKLPHDRLEGDLITIGLPAIIMHICYEAKIPYAWVAIDDWRERFLGTKRAPPGLVQREARTKWFKDSALSTCLQHGWLVEDHNAAEALGIMYYGLCCASPAFLRRSGPEYRRKQGRTVLL